MIKTCFIFMFTWMVISTSQQFSQEKRFNVVAEPNKNGTIMLRLKERYGINGVNGIMGDQGPVGIPGPPGSMGAQGSPGFCSAKLCNSMLEVQSLMSRVEKLEMLVKSRDLSRGSSRDPPRDLSRDLSRDQSSQQAVDGGNPFMQLHITSDILFTKGNISSKSGINGLPKNLNLNIVLKNNAKVAGKPNAGLLSNGKNRKFSVNSTVFLDPSTGNELKSGIATPRPSQGEEMTEKQTTQADYGQKEVPSIKKNKIPHIHKP